MPPRRLKNIIEGLFGSKVVYRNTVLGKVWKIPGTMDKEAGTRTSPRITKDDLQKIEVLHNKSLRLVTEPNYKTATKVLLR